MKWLVWTPAIAIVFAAVAVPGGLVLFALPLLALGYFLFAVIALSGREKRHAAERARPMPIPRERCEPASHPRKKRASTRPQPAPARAAFATDAAGLGGTTTTRRRR